MSPSSSFLHQLTHTANTKRNALVNGKRTGYVANLTGVPVTPPCPLDATRGSELGRMMTLDTAYELVECFTLGSYDIQGNDILTIEGKDYYVRAIFRWDFHGEDRLDVVLEDVRK